MATATDMDTMAGIGDAIVDKYLGGHADADLTALYTYNKGIYKNESKAIRLLFGLVGELINKVYDLENP